MPCCLRATAQTYSPLHHVPLLPAARAQTPSQASKPWGLSCLRCEIRDIQLPDQVVVDMQRQVSAERRKRAAILESEGDRDAAINVAEGKKQVIVIHDHQNATVGHPHDDYQVLTHPRA